MFVVIRQLETRPQAKDTAKKAVTYFTNNQHRMDYDHSHQEGYVIGSGTVESGCKPIVSYRLKCSVASWNEIGSRHTAKARVTWISDQWSQLSKEKEEVVFCDAKAS